MPSIQVKHVPDDVHATLRRRAAAAGQSLQEYLRSKLIHDARHPTNAELFDRIDARRGAQEVSADEVTRIIRAARDAR